MSAEADALCGAPYGQPGEERVSYRNRYRDRRWDTRVLVHGLIATGVNADGTREILGFDVPSAEDGAGGRSSAAWPGWRWSPPARTPEPWYGSVASRCAPLVPVAAVSLICSNFDNPIVRHFPVSPPAPATRWR
jgi:Transposase, Mutator family